MNSELKIQDTIHGKRHKVLWTDHETVINNRPFPIPDIEVPFKLANHVKLRRSVFGIFLENLNSQQNQDESTNDNKLSMFNFDFKNFKANEMQHFDDDNDFTEDILSLLVKVVHTENVIRGDCFYKNVHMLKFVNLPMTVLDHGLRAYVRLQKLVLSGNLIKEVHGRDLPRRLQYLELFANDIADLKDFTVAAPKKLIYLGLQRNKIHNGSRLHLVGDCGNFVGLRCLDLADNDICDLKCALAALHKLHSLRYLQLEGNPCAMFCVYKDAVLKELPQLVYLDNTEILPEDRELFKFTVDVKAAIVFNCHWIIGLPPPRKQKGVIHTFHIEVNMPLLEEDIVEPEIDPEETIEEPAPKSDKSSKKGGKDKSKGSKGKSKNGKSKKGKKSVYDAEDEYESERRARVKNTSFKTDRFSWAKVIQLPEEALVIQSLDGSLADIRDTFRSGVNVKLIYLQILNPPKTKSKKEKGKKNKKSKEKGDKKNKSKNKGDEKKETEEPQKVEEPPAVDKPPEEIISKKITLANFRCDLHGINWSDKTIDFFWADSPQTNPCAAEVPGSLRMINYKDGSKKKDKNATANKAGNAYPPVSLPKFFNIQVGFGLKRSYYQDVYSD